MYGTTHILKRQKAGVDMRPTPNFPEQGLLFITVLPPGDLYASLNAKFLTVALFMSSVWNN